LSAQWYAAAMAYSLVEYACVKRVLKERNVTCMHIGVKSPTVVVTDDVATKECAIVREAGQEMVRACPHPTCSDRGVCVDGRCYCADGWRGVDCGTPIVEPTQAVERTPTIVAALVPAVELIPATAPTEKPRQVSRELDRQKLPEPSKFIHPPPNCNNHGKFVAGVCRCDQGWEGVECERGDDVFT
ncbi:EGF-like domain protein, partial [Ancylostoma ceylanicum]